jgi:hypothetical protein
MSIGFAIDSMGDMGVTFVDTLEQMTIGVLEFLKQFVDIGRTIALTVSLVGALTGNVALTLKATAASLAFKAAQQGINGALERTPGLFDKLREAAAKAGAVQAAALPRIIGTADALERAAKATVVKTEEDGKQEKSSGGVAKTVATAKEKLEKYTSALKSSTTAQKSFTSAQKAAIQAQKGLDEAILQPLKRTSTKRSLDMVRILTKRKRLSASCQNRNAQSSRQGIELRSLCSRFVKPKKNLLNFAKIRRQVRRQSVKPKSIWRKRSWLSPTQAIHSLKQRMD